MLQEEIKAVLTGTVAVVSAQQQLVHATAVAALAHLNAEIDAALRPLKQLRAHLVAAEPSLFTAVRTGARAGNIHWQSRAANAFRSALSLHQLDLGALTKQHAAHLRWIDQQLLALERTARALTLTHPIVLAMAAVQLAGIELTAAVGNTVSQAAAAVPEAITIPVPVPINVAGAHHG
ncbi:hypothetical protein [Micrococcoides hystricis]|uniref:Uncharacterized protein n=1 Tax=Micrococcoides hystricis TaxID=1572761 RepID=A0ABV6P7V5_9MICC